MTQGSLQRKPVANLDRADGFRFANSGMLKKSTSAITSYDTREAHALRVGPSPEKCRFWRERNEEWEWMSR